MKAVQAQDSGLNWLWCDEEDETSALWRFHASQRGHGAVQTLEIDERINAA